MSTHRKHFEDLQSIRSPAFLGFVYWQWKVNIPGILREEQHQKYSPVEQNNVITSLFTLFYNSCGYEYIFLLLALTPEIINLTASVVRDANRALTGPNFKQRQQELAYAT